jgi:hypothetical protein
MSSESGPLDEVLDRDVGRHGYLEHDDSDTFALV